MKIENVDVEKLLPYEKNARLHSKKQIKQIADSIKMFGFNNPILIAENYEIIAGHGRAEAAKLLKLKSAPCIKLPHLTDKQRRAYVIADNKIALNATWDMDILQLEIAELSSEFSAESLGFEIAEFNFTPNLPSENENEDAEKTEFILKIICKNEDDQQMLFTELNARGIKVKSA